MKGRIRLFPQKKVRKTFFFLYIYFLIVTYFYHYFVNEYFENWAADNGYKGQGYAEPSPSGESVNLYINIPLVNDKGRAVRALNYATLFLRDANFRSLYKMRPEQVGLGHAILKIEDCK